jgi:hypothetical protein
MEEELNLYDDFLDDRSAGSVIGTRTASGHERFGVDVEKVLGIDNGALRIAPLVEVGFGRAVLSYGPFPRRDGLAFSVRILNGHNTAQAGSLPDTFRNRIGLWFQGSHADPRWRRLARWLASGRVRRTVRQFRWWKRTAKDSAPVPLMDENLAVGWFETKVVPDPRQAGSAFIMHALGPENGELWTGGNGTRTRALRGVQNLPLYLVTILRPEGMVYYVSSMDGAPGMVPHPFLRPIALEYGTSANELYLGIQQSVLGQIGWRLDTRIQGVRVAHLEGYASWCGGAVAADQFEGDRDIDGSQAEVGGAWRVFGRRAQNGLGMGNGSDAGTMSVLNPASPTGLVHALAPPGKGDDKRVGLVWRFIDERNHWRMEVGRRVCEVILVEEGERRICASTGIPGSKGEGGYRLQVLDDGRHMMAYVDGEPVAESWITDTQFEGATGVGFLVSGQGDGERGSISLFEAHPRSIGMPDHLDMGSTWMRKGDRIVAADDFGGAAGNLEGRQMPTGGLRWRRLMGSGVIETTGESAARIRGSVDEPCPDRTAYCVDWENPDFVDLEVTIISPGTGRGQKQRSTAGFILYQDRDNYVTLNVWRADYYGGASISTFFKFGGFEDLYDAIWTNVADRVYYGRPSQLRVCCDGERYLVFVNEEPVLYRAFRDVYPDVGRLRIRKVGLLANWEFGNDTGSRFGQFRART